ncbi:MAG: SurA N-terminal domain-containing protein [Deltaproteobacteria bacterium]
MLVPWCAASAETLNRVVASVDYQAITERDVVTEFHYEQLLNGTLPKGEPSSQTRGEMRTRLVEQALLAEEARDARLPEVPPQTLAQDLADLRKKFDSPRTFEDALRASGLDEAGLLERLRRRDLIAEQTELRLRPQVWVEPSEIEAYYKETFVPEFKQHSQEPPPAIDEVTDKIRDILVEQKINKLLDDWISDLKTIHRVDLAPM